MLVGGFEGPRAVVNRFYAAFDRRDHDALASLVAPELVWDVPQAVEDAGPLDREEALQWLAAPMPAAYAMRRERWRCAGDEIEVTGAHLHGSALTGAHAIAFVHRLRVADGRIVHFHEHLPEGLLRAHAVLRLVAPLKA